MQAPAAVEDPSAAAEAKPAPTPKSRKPEAPNGRRKLVESETTALTLEQLTSLGYVDGLEDPNAERSGVLKHNRAMASPGLNFYTSRRQRGAYLVDMEGNVVHRWSAEQPGAWQHAELLPDGDVVAIVKDERLTRYDSLSNVIWSIKGRFHHDFWIHGNEIFALSRRARVVPYVHLSVPTLEDVIEVVSLEDGKKLRTISILDLIHESPYAFLLPSVAYERFRRKNTQLDVLHTNHVEVMDGRLEDRGTMYAEGNVLICSRNINALIVFDPKSLNIEWIWGPTNLTYPHHPTLLDNGRILLFDNGTEASRVIEVEPRSNQLFWRYAPGRSFFSKTRGSNQRLPNGNTLITESDKGYVLEVTRRGQVVWKFANPRVNKRNVREAIWRMTRVAPETLTFLD